ncbi:semaphorin-7A [Salminus brasiliensis]|uniref:semaphorin-7A n=1 Tax=Salminus brasiliensis TaxID=930266 RepID=UPI003B835F91
MSHTALCTALLALIWTQVGQAKQDKHHHHAARILINHTEAEFKRFWIPTDISQMNSVWKLVKDPVSSDIYGGGLHGLFKFNTEQTGTDVEQVFNQSISLLTEQNHGSQLFICKKTNKDEEDCNCCYLKSKSDCFKINTPVHVKDASLVIGKTLYFAMSGESTVATTLGLYKQNKDSFTWPQPIQITTRYVKILANRDSEALDGKVYSFYIEKNSDKNPETPLWIPRVSQYCMADKGGTKNQLQYRWTSMLTARLFCGNKIKKMTFTELLDVSVLETSSNTMIYALFKNEYGIRAVCVYTMSEITRVFTSAKFRNKEEPSIQTAGECVEDSRTLSSAVLKFMEKRPEMEEWIEPERGPLLVSNHWYKQLQVDMVNHHNILLLTLESGKIHKVLEEKDGHFIIAEYQPFENNTQIHSMLLDRSTKKLYVSSSNQVVQINLQDCSRYGDKCTPCVLARDPYCSWTGILCLPATNLNGDMRSGTVCKEGERVSARMNGREALIIPQDSKYYLKCSAPSQYASYTWIHDGAEKECLSTDEDCLLLIESMSESDEGTYQCKASENGQIWTVSSYQLQKGGASHLRVAPAVLMCLLLICVMLL